jgi:uncharacterized Fe-S cluster protein YjdI
MVINSFPSVEMRRSPAVTQQYRTYTGYPCAFLNSAAMEDFIRKYSNGEITVVWKPGTCIHSRLCWKELGAVFNPSAKPWVNITGATSQRIMEQVKKCPSGALSFYRDHEGPSLNPVATSEKELRADSTPVKPMET